MAKAKRSKSEAKLARLRAQLIDALAGLDETLDVQRDDPGTVRVVALGEGLVEFDRSRFRVAGGASWYPFNVQNRLQADYLRESVGWLVSVQRMDGRSGLVRALAALDAELQAASEWIDALRKLGVPAAAQLGVVDVEDIGRVPLPDRPLADAAKSFLDETDRSSLPWIIGRARRELGPAVAFERAKTHVLIWHRATKVGLITPGRVNLARGEPGVGN